MTNPWSRSDWNVTMQGMIARTRGLSAAKAMAAAVGSRIGATRPTVPDAPKKIHMTNIFRRTTIVQDTGARGYSGEGEPGEE